MNKFWKKILAATLSAATAVTLLVPTTFAKAEGTYTSASEQAGKVLANPSAGEANVTYGTGLQQTKFLQAADDSTTSSVTGPRRSIRREPSSSSSSSTNRTNSSSDYFYNTLLNDNEKAFYDAIDQECYKYLTTDTNAIDTKAKVDNTEITYKTTEKITYDNSSIDSTRANNIASVFRYENPQYYFLENAVLQGYSTSGTSTTYYVKMVLFDDFASGSARSSYTTKFNNAVNEYLTAINKGTTYYDKEKIAHDLLIKNIVYNTVAKYNQSSCSGLVEKSTVCMGYAASFQLLMNRVGVETIVVSSSNHAWNEIKLDGNWYVVDVTWDDPIPTSGSPASGNDSNKSYFYFNISDSTLSGKDNDNAHVKDSIWSSFNVPACPKDYDASSGSTTPVTGISFDKSELTFTEGDTATQKITATISPATATNTKINWNSDNPSVATVDSKGNVQAVGVGTAKITATSDDNSSISATCIVTVNKKVVKVASVTLSKTSLEMKVGGSDETLTATVAPENATSKDVTWTSDNTSVATVENGTVKAIGVGTATITASAGGKSATCTVNVTKDPILVTSISISAGKTSLVEGDTETFTATVLPQEADNKDITWASSDTNVATVDQGGNVTAVKAGTVKITATAKDASSVYGSVDITVTAKTISVSDVSLDKSTLSLEKDGTATLNATVNPSNATNKKVSWVSSDTSVATVDENGKVTAKGKGTAKITVKTEDGGKIAECSVTVTEKTEEGGSTGGSTGGLTGETGGTTGGSTGETGGSTGGSTGGLTGETGGTTGGSTGGTTGGSTGETGGSTGGSTGETGGSTGGSTGGTTGGTSGGSTGGTTGGSTGGSTGETGGSTGGSTGGTSGGSTGSSTGCSTGGNTSTAGNTSTTNDTASSSGTKTSTNASSTSSVKTSANASSTSSVNTSTNASSTSNVNTSTTSTLSTTTAPASVPSERTINTTPTRDEIAGRNLVSTVVVQPTATDDGGIKHQDVYVQSDIFKINQALESLSKNKLIRSLTRTKTVTIDMKQGASVPANIIPKEVLQTAEGQKVNLKFDMGDYSWTIKGKDITDAGVKDINLGLNETSAVIPEAVLKSVSGKNSSTQFSIKHSGEFGFQAKHTLYVGKQYRGKYANFYTYDGNNIELSGYAKVNRKGYVTVDFNHGPYYGIVFSKRHAKPSK